jgi:hypothetical protein
MRTPDLTLFRRMVAMVVVGPVLLVATAGCGDDVPSSPSSSATADASTIAAELSAIACATEDPVDGGELTGAWKGDDRMVYYIRQVGDCLWWLGTDLADIESGRTGQSGVANVASGRVDGINIVVEWADLPAGDIVGGGGLTLLYDEAHDQLAIVEQRGGGVRYGATLLTRIEPNSSSDASPSESASP